MSERDDRELSRRRGFLQWMAASTCGLIGSSTLDDANSAETTQAQANEAYPKNPEEALKKLLDGNQRFAAGESLAEHREISRVREVAAGQKPFAAFLGCADSRVPIEAIADNVRNQATILAEASTVISKLIQRKELIVVGGIYDLKTGLVSVVDIPLD